MLEGFKRCSRCRTYHRLEAFAWKRKDRGQRNSYCRRCQKAYGREHCDANKQWYLDQALASKNRLRHERTQWLLGYFREHPCVDCGETDPIVLEFDHLRDKEFDVGTFVSCRWEAVLAEIEKCEVVCANCHRRRTARRRPTVRLLLLEVERAAGIEPVSFSLEG